MNPLRTRLAAAALGAGVVFAAPGSAWAGPRHNPSPTASDAPSPDITRSNDIESVRSRCLAAIDTRLARLSDARARVTADGHVTNAHKAFIVGDFEATAARLHTLADGIRTDTDLNTLRDHCRSIFEDNRVFALVLPRARIVVGSDTAADVAARLDGVAAKLEAAIAKAEAAGADVTQARADLDAMKAKVASGAATAGSIPGTVIGLTPADWNADHTLLDPARGSLRSAHADLKAARDLAVAIRSEVRPPAAAQT